jgi:hypothetical protein
VTATGAVSEPFRATADQRSVTDVAGCYAVPTI